MMKNVLKVAELARRIEERCELDLVREPGNNVFGDEITAVNIDGVESKQYARDLADLTGKTATAEELGYLEDFLALRAVERELS